MVIGREKHLGSKVLTAAAISVRFMPWLLPSAKIHCERFAGRINRFLKTRDKPGRMQ
jgi:hypothetical protein